jgi:hypothetical protein
MNDYNRIGIETTLIQTSNISTTWKNLSNSTAITTWYVFMESHGRINHKMNIEASA